MKYRTTEREVRATANGCVVKVGYCQLQNLLSHEIASAYTCGVYGWNADIYEVGGYVICEGYRPFGKSASYELTRKYEGLAVKVLKDKRIRKYETKTEKLRALIESFCAEVIG